MKIELKNTSFKYLYEQMSLGNYPDADLLHIIEEELKPQYDKAFLKYQDEKQEFQVREKVQFKWPGSDWYNGTISKVNRLSNGQYTYIVRYLEPAEDWHYDEN